MPDDAQNGRIRHDVLGIGHTHFGLALVIKRHNLDCEAHGLQAVAQLLNRQLGAVLDAFAHGRAAA